LDSLIKLLKFKQYTFSSALFITQTFPPARFYVHMFMFICSGAGPQRMLMWKILLPPLGSEFFMPQPLRSPPFNQWTAPTRIFIWFQEMGTADRLWCLIPLKSQNSRIQAVGELGGLAVLTLAARGIFRNYLLCVIKNCSTVSVLPANMGLRGHMSAAMAQNAARRHKSGQLQGQQMQFTPGTCQMVVFARIWMFLRLLGQNGSASAGPCGKKQTNIEVGKRKTGLGSPKCQSAVW